jgi:hypothetical protein
MMTHSLGKDAIRTVRHERRATAVHLVVACVLTVSVLLAHSGTTWAAPHLGAPTRTCLSTNASVCRIMPASGTFALPIPGTKAALIGVGTPDRAGKAIVISRAKLVCKTLGGIGIRIVTPRSASLLPPIRWSNGTLYYRDSRNGRCVGVSSPALAAAPGVYQVVPTSVARMPTTGGAGDKGTVELTLPLVLGLFMLLLGIYLSTRSAVAQPAKSR